MGCGPFSPELFGLSPQAPKRLRPVAERCKPDSAVRRTGRHMQSFRLSPERMKFFERKIMFTRKSSLMAQSLLFAAAGIAYVTKAGKVPTSPNYLKQVVLRFPGPSLKVGTYPGSSKPRYVRPTHEHFCFGWHSPF